jgi:hypothetical protein
VTGYDIYTTSHETVVRPPTGETWPEIPRDETRRAPRLRPDQITVHHRRRECWYAKVDGLNIRKDGSPGARGGRGYLLDNDDRSMFPAPPDWVREIAEDVDRKFGDGAW